MENLEFEFIDRAITILKEESGEQAAQLIREETGLSQVRSRIFIAIIVEMLEG